MEYYSALKKKEVLQQLVAWVSLGDIVLSEMSPSQKTNAALFQVLAALENNHVQGLKERNGSCLPGSGETRERARSFPEAGRTNYRHWTYSQH